MHNLLNANCRRLNYCNKPNFTTVGRGEVQIASRFRTIQYVHMVILKQKYLFLPFHLSFLICLILLLFILFTPEGYKNICSTTVIKPERCTNASSRVLRTHTYASLCPTRVEINRIEENAHSNLQCTIPEA